MYVFSKSCLAYVVDCISVKSSLFAGSAPRFPVLESLHIRPTFGTGTTLHFAWIADLLSGIHSPRLEKVTLAYDDIQRKIAVPPESGCVDDALVDLHARSPNLKVALEISVFQIKYDFDGDELQAREAFLSQFPKLVASGVPIELMPVSLSRLARILI